MTWNVDKGISDSFFNICQRAALDDSVFKSFRSHPDFNQVLEHVDRERGQQYLDIALEQTSQLEKLFPLFAQNDLIGGPSVFPYGKFTFSPTTLRYIKVLSDLIIHFGGLDGLRIAEIGCGYGGQCSIIKKAFKLHSYTLFDNTNVYGLQKKYLGACEIENIKLGEPQDSYDLVISNYAFDELGEDLKTAYFDSIISKSAMGYFTFASPVRLDLYFKKPIQRFPQNHIYDLPYHETVIYK